MNWYTCHVIVSKMVRPRVGYDEAGSAFCKISVQAENASLAKELSVKAVRKNVLELQSARFSDQLNGSDVVVLDIQGPSEHAEYPIGTSFEWFE